MSNLTKIKVVKMTDNEIVLEKAEDLETTYDKIKDETNVILQWEENGKLHSQLFIAEGQLTKIKDGSLKLTSQEDVKEENKK